MSINTIQSMVRWVDENITQEPSLQQLSAYMGYSPFYCSAKFRQHMQITFKQYIAAKKMQCAAEEIQNGDTNILDIAQAYGFSSHAAFTRAFTKCFGQSPSQYRSRNSRNKGDEKGNKTDGKIG